MPVRVTIEEADFRQLVSGQVLQKYFIDEQHNRRLVQIALGDIGFPRMKELVLIASNERALADGKAAEERKK